MKHVSQRAMIAGAIELKGDEDEPVALVQKAIDDLTKSIDDRIKAIEAKGGNAETDETLKSLGARLDALEKKGSRPPATGEARDEQQVATEKKAWLTYLRRGQQTDDVDLKVLTVANDTQAGYLAPAEVSREMIRDIAEISPIRQYATVRQSMAPSVKYPKRGTGTNAKWEGETETSEESNVTFGQKEIVSKRLTTYVDISNSLLMGSDGTAEAEVRSAFADDFAEKEGRAFVLGDGLKEPEGILTNPDIDAIVNGHATNISTDKLIDLMYALKAPYRRRGVWLMNSSTIASIRKLKNGTTGEYIWQPALRDGEPDTLLGRPLIDVPDWPDIGDGNYPIAFGDLATAYRIVDRQQLATLTDPYTQAKNAITRIHATTWVGGGVVQPAAIKKLKSATS